MRIPPDLTLEIRRRAPATKLLTTGQKTCDRTGDVISQDRELATIGRNTDRLAAVLIKIFGSQAVCCRSVIGLVPFGYKYKTLGCKKYPFTSRRLIVAVVASMAIWLYFVGSLILQHNPNVCSD